MRVLPSVRFFGFLALGLILGWPQISQAQVTIYNHTPNDYFIASAGYVIGVDSSGLGQDNNASNSWVGTSGWYKVTRYGGSVTLPAGTSMFVRIGGKFVYHKDAKKFPMHEQNTTNFSRSFGKGEDPWRSGALQSAAASKGLSMETFVPVTHFRDPATGKYEITTEKLSSGMPLPPPVVIPPTTISITLKNDWVQKVEFRLNSGAVQTLNPKKTMTYTMTGVNHSVWAKQSDGSFRFTNVSNNGRYVFDWSAVKGTYVKAY